MMYKINIWFSSLINNNFIDLFDRMQATPNLEEIIPLLEGFTEDLKTLIKDKQIYDSEKEIILEVDK